MKCNPISSQSYTSPGQEAVWSCIHTVTQLDIDQGFYDDDASAIASSDPDLSTGVVLPRQTVTVRQTVPIQMLSLEATGVALSRYQMRWDITLTNIGNLTVTPQDVSSRLCGSISLPSDQIGPGQSVSGSCVSTVSESYIQQSMGQVWNSFTETTSDQPSGAFVAIASAMVVAPD
jgi:hypothetical protein